MKKNSPVDYFLAKRCAGGYCALKAHGRQADKPRSGCFPMGTASSRTSHGSRRRFFESTSLLCFVAPPLSHKVGAFAGTLWRNLKGLFLIFITMCVIIILRLSLIFVIAMVGILFYVKNACSILHTLLYVKLSRVSRAMRFLCVVSVNRALFYCLKMGGENLEQL